MNIELGDSQYDLHKLYEQANKIGITAHDLADYGINRVYSSDVITT